jgi:hypothetical protein
MRFFGGNRSSDNDPGREYLASAPPGPRTEVLSSACVLQLREFPLADRTHRGQPLYGAEFAEATALVSGVMHQDRDLSAWVARKAMVNLDIMMRAGMAGSEADNMATAFAMVGLDEKAELQAEHTSRLDDDARTEAVGLAGCAVSVLVAIRERKSHPRGWRSSDHPLYEDLFTGASGAQVERLAYEITAWASVVVARLMNADLFTRVLPTLAPSYREVPKLHRPGWYPNPSRTGEIVGGVAEVQRYWDGQWTDRVRLRSRGGWQMLTAPLHAPPTD